MGRRWSKLWAALAVCLALAVTVWPAAVRIAEAEAQARQVEELEKRVASLGEAQLGDYRNLAKWYNHQLELGAPGLWAAYGHILDLGEGRMAVLEVPELNLRRAIFHGEAGVVGHDPASHLPIGGRGNHTVFLLSEAYTWAPGQTVYIDVLGQRMIYRVESVQVMPAGWSPERPTEAGQDLLTFVYDRGNTRTLVRCARSSDLTVRPMDSTELRRVILAAALPLGLLLPALLGRRRRSVCDQSLRICGFCRKTREKSNLS